MTTSNKNQEARISELERNQEEIFGGLIEKFNNTTQEVLKSVLENELADIRRLIKTRDIDKEIDKKVLDKTDEQLQIMFILKELDKLKAQIKELIIINKELDKLKEQIEELIIINREKRSWFARLFGL